MCADHQSGASHTDQAGEADLCPKARTLLAYLETTVGSEAYLKSRFIAQEIGLSAKEIGAMMAKLQDEPVNLTIEKWGYTNGTTWRVKRESDQR